MHEAMSVYLHVRVHHLDILYIGARDKCRKMWRRERERRKRREPLSHLIIIGNEMCVCVDAL